MILETLAVGPLGCNCTILGCPETRRAIVVDPGGDVERIRAMLDRHGLVVEGILHTHAHFDHLLGTDALKASTGGTVMLHEGDRPLWESAPMQGGFFGIRVSEPPPVERWVQDEEELAWGLERGRVLHTPGHTPGSLCLHVGAHRVVLTGDTLFAGGVGRTDLWGGSYPELMRSIHERLLTLDDETVVIPGHGELTTVGRERASNPFLV